MLLDLLVTALASAVIGWNLGNWRLPASWIAVVSLAAIINKVQALRRTVDPAMVA